MIDAINMIILGRFFYSSSTSLLMSNRVFGFRFIKNFYKYTNFTHYDIWAVWILGLKGTFTF